MHLVPNAITLIRLFTSPVLAWFIVQSRFREALALVVLAGVTDWLDGFAARKLRSSGKSGVILDPLADKVMLVTLFLALGAVGLIKPWLVALVIGRDLVIVVGALLVRRLRQVRQFPPSTLGKVSTFFQIVFVVTVLLYASFPYQFLLWLLITALVLTALFTVLSGLAYVRLGIRFARRSPVSAAH